MRILIVGDQGQLGNELKRCLTAMTAEIGPIPQAYRDAEVVGVDRGVLDIAQRGQVEAFFKANERFDLVINSAAMTNVDGCEADEASALRINAFGAENLARAAEATGSKIVHVSTDYVFPGTDPAPRTEGDPVRPISAYGRSKWAGEVLVRAACPRSFVVRTAWLYGYVGRNFVKTMLRLARQNGAVSVVDDQLGNPTSANDLANEILALALTEAYGTYHCTNNGTCSWFDFASAAIRAAGIPCELEAISSPEYKRRFPQSADRPAFSSLENAHLAEAVGDEMRPWQEALSTYMANLPEQEDVQQ